MQSVRWALGLCSLMMLAGCVADAPFPQDTVTTSDPTDFEAVTPTPSEEAPETGETWQAKFETSQGDFTIEVHPEWAPRGAARFRELVEQGFFKDVRFFRNVKDFMVQFGINGDPVVAAKWKDANIPDDPVKQSNQRGMVTFATSGPGSRTTQLFINFSGNKGLDGQGFSPFGRVVEGMSVVDKFHNGYGERPDQGRVQGEGNAYLIKEFPKLDYIKSVTIVTPDAAPVDAAEGAPAAEAKATPADEPKATPASEGEAAPAKEAEAAPKKEEAAPPAETPEPKPEAAEAPKVEAEPAKPAAEAAPESAPAAESTATPEPAESEEK